VGHLGKRNYSIPRWQDRDLWYSGWRCDPNLDIELHTCGEGDVTRSADMGDYIYIYMYD
jgi:hypothetical protein